MDAFTNFLTNSFSNCVWLAVMLVALCPLLESKIAIPIALNSAMWAGNTLSPIYAFFISFLGSSLPCLLVIFVARKIKAKTTGFIANKFASKYLIKANKLSGFNSFQKYLALCSFSALPLPLTGVWSSSAIAGFTDLKIGKSIISILIGNAISSAIILSLCILFKNSIGYILLFSITIIILFLFIDLFGNAIKTLRNKKIHT